MSSEPTSGEGTLAVASGVPDKEREQGHGPADHDHVVDKAELARVALVAIAAAAVWLRVWEPFPHVSVIGLAAALVGGYPIFKEAAENILERKMTMELSMTIALVA